RAYRAVAVSSLASRRAGWLGRPSGGHRLAAPFGRQLVVQPVEERDHRLVDDPLGGEVLGEQVVRGASGAGDGDRGRILLGQLARVDPDLQRPGQQRLHVLLQPGTWLLPYVYPKPRVLRYAVGQPR